LEMRISLKNYLKKVLRQNFEKLINNPQRERKAILLEINRLNKYLSKVYTDGDIDVKLLVRSFPKNWNFMKIII
jgi:hypothetical protein